MLDISTQLVQPTIDGLFEGGVLALAALGLSMIFSVMGVLNLAHGDFIMLGGFAGLLLSESIFSFSNFGLFAVLGILLTAFLLIAALGAIYELVFIKFILRRSFSEILISSILVTVGTSFVIETVGYQQFPSLIGFGQTFFTIHVPVQSLALSLGSIDVSGAQVIAFLSIVVATLSLYLFSRRTFLGKAMRAISQNPESALLMGIDPRRIYVLTFALGSGFGALAGISIALSSTMSPGFGIVFTISLLAVMVLGGTKSYLGPLIGGILIGLIESFVQTDLTRVSIFGGTFDFQAWSPAISIIILIIVLMIRPTGLTGRGGAFGRA